MGKSRWVRWAVVALATAPWPQMRLDERNTARSPIPEAVSPAAKPWQVKTGKGIFNTPVVDGRGVAYVGSADGKVYAIARNGRVRWTFRTGGILDAGGLLIGKDLIVGSGDETLYRLRTRPGLSARKRVVWRFKTPLKPATGQLVNWWEGPLSRAPDGDILAGNTGGGAHKITPEGKLVYVRQAGNSVWTAPATGEDGTTFWGSVDRSLFALDPAGKVKWSTPTLGFVTASPSITDDGTVVSASFDGKVYALDASTGLPKWTFQTRDHVYGGPALSKTGLIVVGSTDGGLYGLSPAGALVWRYDTGDPIRSSPAIGVARDGTEIAYVGSSNGKLYAIDVATGRRRWSFDTTPAGDPVLADRNDLNGSPALARDRVIIGGEHGSVWGIPYDYCLRATGDARCDTSHDDDVPVKDGPRVLPITSGGTTLDELVAVPPATTLTGRLLVRSGDETIDAAAVSPLVTAPFDFTLQPSGDGAYLHVVPTDFLEPNTTYEVKASGAWTADGVAVGNTVVGGTRAGSFDDVLRFRTAPVQPGPSLKIGARKTTAFVLRRLAVPLPPLLPSVNQIGFDSYDLIAGLVAAGDEDAAGDRKVLLWVIAARRDRRNRLVPDPAGGFAFPLAGRTRGDQFLLRRNGLNLRFSFGDVPVRRFELRGSLDERGRSRPGTSLYAEVTCNDVPNYGPLLIITGICNTLGTLVAGGTFLVEPYSRAVRPRGVQVSELTLEPPSATAAGKVTATLSGSFKAASNVASVLLVGPDFAPVGLDYLTQTSVKTSERGDIREVTVRIPAGTVLPAGVSAVVMTNAFALETRPL